MGGRSHMMGRRSDVLCPCVPIEISEPRCPARVGVPARSGSLLWCRNRVHGRTLLWASARTRHIVFVTRAAWSRAWSLRSLAGVVSTNRPVGLERCRGVRQRLSDRGRSIGRPSRAVAATHRALGWNGTCRGGHVIVSSRLFGTESVHI